jgi:hypothetical protein
VLGHGDRHDGDGVDEVLLINGAGLDVFKSTHEAGEGRQGQLGARRGHGRGDEERTGAHGRIDAAARLLVGDQRLVLTPAGDGLRGRAAASAGPSGAIPIRR